MCFRNKWTKFLPSKKYLDTVKDLTSVAKLHTFIQQFKRKEDIKDYWQTPEETLNRLTYDCDDVMRFTVDVLVRVIKKEAVGMAHYGYNKALWGNEKMGHAITVFPYQGKLAIFSNKELKTGFDSYTDAGHYTFKDGLKSYIIRDYLGKILSKKSKLVGTF